MNDNLKKLSDKEWENIREIVVFGYGRQGKKIIQKLKKDFKIIAIVENDSEKRGYNADGIQILHFEEAIPLLKKNKTIVAVIEAAYREISKQLMGLGLTEYLDFVKGEYFIAEYYSRFRSQICIMKSDLFLTSYCSLKCEKCGSFIPYWKKHMNIELENLKETLDEYFKRVDYVFSMDMSGGEALLYKKLPELLKYIDDNYREKIAYLGLVTNGTIIPSEEILNALEKYHICVSISDYAGVSNYNSKVHELRDMLEKRNISYIHNPDMIWVDKGFPNTPCGYTDENVIEHRKNCNASNHLICDSKFFYCVASFAAYKGGLFPLSKDDYIDLKQIDETDIEERKKILEYALGNLKTSGGYNGFCNVCGGWGDDNQKKVVAGEQIKG